MPVAVDAVCLVVDDEPHIRRAVRNALAAEFDRVLEAATANEALDLAAASRPARALAIGLVATVLITADMLILTITEAASFLSILFEVVSAFGTVGLSMGLTPDLSVVGKLVISLTMLLGRIGPLAVGFALVARPRHALFSYAEGKVFVG
ncbi:MAG: hypothetical protein HY701_07575 [Gemmatimonadetes bacterium]|nr:hypothetical protein [Gemmatimonadota bacterium]